MATETTNLKLNKPDKTDFYNIDLVNANMDKIDEAIAGKAGTTHKHNKADISDFPSSLPANGGNADTVGGKTPSEFASASHTHDERYYTETEVDTKLNAKANSSHTHTKAQITDFPTSLPANGGNADTVDGYHVTAGDSWGLKVIGCGTGDMTAGVTGLSNGNIYVVYE